MKDAVTECRKLIAIGMSLLYMLYCLFVCLSCGWITGKVTVCTDLDEILWMG